MSATPIRDPDKVLALLRDPNVESAEIAALAGVPREEAGRAARLVLGLGRAKPQEVATLPGPLAAAIARAALGTGRADLLAALAAHADRDVSKEARRGLHVLRSRGVAVPEAQRPAAPPAPAPREEPPPPSYASFVDGRGERAIWLTRLVPGRGVEIGQAIVSDVRGLVELQVGVLGRKEYRAFAKSLVERGGTMGLGEIDRERAKAIVASARRLNDTTGERVPDGADRWLAALGPVAPQADPAERFPRLEPDAEGELLAGSARLHDLPLLRGWLADEAVLRGLAAKLDEIAVSPIYVDERQRAEAVTRAIAAATDDALAPERRPVLAARLFTAAEHLAAKGDAASAATAAAVGRAIRDGLEAARIPFVRALVEKAFPPAPSAGEPRTAAPEPGGSGLIVAPR